MAKIEKSIDVNVPLRTAYNQWTQFEEFPAFMEGIREVRQLDDKRLLWRAEIGGNEEQWYAEISEQIPDQRIAWHSTSGVTNAGVVTFHYINPDTTRVMLQMEYEPEGPVETIGDVLGFVSRRVQGDLERFKQFIESRGVETGAWRGQIEQSHSASSPPASSTGWAIDDSKATPDQAEGERNPGDKNTLNVGRTPGQAEGDRQTVEEDLRRKGM